MRKIGADRSGAMVVWSWVAASALLIAPNPNRVCGQFRPPVGPSAQDLAAAKASAEATSSAQWSTSVFVLAVFGWFAFSIRGALISFFKTFAGGFEHDSATTDLKKRALGEPEVPEHLAQVQGGERTGPSAEPTPPH
jgi:hypothetical protein